MSKIWCNESDCWYNKKSRCKAGDVFVFEGECIACRYTKPEKGDHRKSRDAREVRMDREAKRVSDKIRLNLLARMNAAVTPNGEPPVRREEPVE